MRVTVDVEQLEVLRNRCEAAEEEIGMLLHAVRTDFETLRSFAQAGTAIPIGDIAGYSYLAGVSDLAPYVADQNTDIQTVSHPVGWSAPDPGGILGALASIGKGAKRAGEWAADGLKDAGRAAGGILGSIIEAVVDGGNETGIPLLLGPLWVLANAVVKGEATRVEQPRSLHEPWGALGDVASVMTHLPPNEMAIVDAGNNNYVVLVRGIDPTGLGPNSIPGSLGTMRTKNDPLTTGVLDAMGEAGIPAGASVMLVGHSQGGIATMNLASSPSFNQKYNLTHVATVGSPVDSKTGHIGADSHARFLHVQNKGDIVPKLDGVTGKHTPHTYTFVREGDEHGIASYAQEMGSTRFESNSDVKKFMGETEPYFASGPKKISKFSIRYQIDVTNKD